MKRNAFIAILALLVFIHSKFVQAECKGAIFDPERARKHHLKVFDLNKKNESNVLRYLNATQGTPPNFSIFPNHKVYYAAQMGGQFCDSSGCTPSPEGGIFFTDNKCVIYQITGTVPQLNKIVNGQWSLTTQ